MVRLNFWSNQVQRSQPGSLWNYPRKLISLRKQHPMFAAGSLRWAQVDQAAIAALWRDGDGEKVLVLHNLSEQSLKIQVAELAQQESNMFNLLTGEQAIWEGGRAGCLLCRPLGSYWLVEESLAKNCRKFAGNCKK